MANGSFYDITVSAPAGNTYNGASFTFSNGAESGASAGSQPVWSFKLTGATADSAALTSITCGGDVAVGARNTGTTTNNVTYVQNLANAINGQTVNGYSYSCSNAAMAFHNPSTVRSAALRNSALSLAKAFSIGLKSGL